MIKILDEKSIVLYPNEGKKRKVVKIECSVCGKEFWNDIRNIKRNKSGIVYCSSECTKNRKKVVCAYCNKTIEKTVGRIEKSRNGIFFCCRKHKDLGQRIENNIREIWPDHFGNIGKTSYRRNAFDHYKHECEECGWDKIKGVLDVHHIDSNRDNNEIENLIILCPICHITLTRKYAVLVNRKLTFPVSMAA